MRRTARGVTLLEGLIAGVVLVIGLTGALQGILAASQQNSVARRMTTLSATAHEIQLGLLARPRATLEASLFSSGTCRPISSLSAAQRRMLGTLDNAGLVAPAAPLLSACAVDLDAWEGTVAIEERLTPRWVADERFTRWLIFAPEVGGAATVYIATSAWNPSMPGSRVVHTQLVGLYDAGPNGNGAGVEL